MSDSTSKNFEKIKLLKKRVINNIDEAVNLAEIERLAISRLPLNALSYYISGAEDETTLKRNRKLYQEILVYPKVLVDVANVDLSTTILGEKISLPICIAPSAYHKMAHFRGELDTAKSAYEYNTNIILSTLSTTSIEDVAKENKTGSRWFQLYVFKDVDFTLNFIKRAEKSGYTGIVLTVDAPVLGYRERDFQVNFKTPEDIEPVNLLEIYNSYLTKQKTIKINSDGKEVADSLSKTGKSSELFTFFSKFISDTITWEFIAWLRKQTKLKIILKGVHRADDALLAEKCGVDAILVSNHGGRQLDTVPSSIEMLASIREALSKDSKMELYVDGGIRRGSDVFKALALGARAVFIGRPILWGLAAAGEKGVKRVLDFLKNELIISMKLAGCVKISDINKDYVRTTNRFAKF